MNSVHPNFGTYKFVQKKIATYAFVHQIFGTRELVHPSFKTYRFVHREFGTHESVSGVSSLMTQSTGILRLKILSTRMSMPQRGYSLPL